MTRDLRGSITQDDNPTGVNQYSGEGGKSDRAKVADRANAQSAVAKESSEKAKAASERAAKGDKESRGYGTSNGGRHSDAAAYHTQAAAAHEKASMLHYTSGNKTTATREQHEANSHKLSAANHEKRMNP